MVLHSRCSSALVCKPWLRTFCDPVFLLLPLPRRRRSPPTRTGAARSRPLYCRHGRALLHVADGGGCWHLVVWDAVTGYQQRLPEPGIPYWLEYSAVVFCAVACCDHLDCHGGPFPVAFIANNNATADPSEWSVTRSRHSG
nr:unnamed protein product [Digitaria exilis]